MQVEVHLLQVPTFYQPSGWLRIKLLPGQILNDHFTTLVVLIARYPGVVRLTQEYLPFLFSTRLTAPEQPSQVIST